MLRFFTLIIAFIVPTQIASAQVSPFGSASNLNIVDIYYLGIAAVVRSDLESDSLESELENNSGYHLFVGYQFTDIIGVEIGYTKLVDAKLSTPNFTVSGDLNSVGVSVLLRSPNDAFSPFLRIGYGNGSVKIASSATENISSDENDFIYGGGLDIGITERGAIRLEYMQAEFDDIDFNSVTLGWVVTF